MADHNERWVLNHLIEMCRDEEQTLRFAAEHVTDLGHNERTLIQDAESTDRDTLSTFEHALEDMLPPASRELIEQQCAELRKDAYAARAAKALDERVAAERRGR